MREPFILESRIQELQARINHIINKGFNAIVDVLAIDQSAASRLKAVGYWHATVDLLFPTVREYLNKVDIKCKRGCSTCCDIRVEVFPVEAVYISSYLLQQDGDFLAGILSKLTSYSAYAKNRAIVDFRRTCPFLGKEGECQIYEVRPHQCRMYHSVNDYRCKKHRKFVQIEAFHDALKTFNFNLSREFLRHDVSTFPAEMGQAVLSVIHDMDSSIQWISGMKRLPLLPEMKQREQVPHPSMILSHVSPDQGV